MSQYVRVASVRFDLEYLRGAPEAPDRVFADTEQQLDALRGRRLDLVALCEGVESLGQLTGDAEEIGDPGRFLRLYMEFARSEHCHVAGSVKIRKDGCAYNAIAFVDPAGRILGAYPKNNLTDREHELGLSPGRDAVTVESAIGRLGGVVCFDLNFEPLRKRYAALRPDILVFASMYHGGFVQQLWAYECRSFFVSALPFNGGGILDPLGEPLALTDEYNPVAIATVNLDRAIIHLDYNRLKFDAIRSALGDEVEIRIPPNLGSALVYSRSDRRSADDIVREFGLVRLDDYFERMQQRNAEAG